MRFRLLAIILLASLCVLALPAGAYAEAPPATPRQIYANGAETGQPAFDLVPQVGASASWGPITNVKRSGLRSLWVAGTAPTKFPVYPSGTIGSAYLHLTDLSDYYNAVLSYWYLSPSRGAADADSFVFYYQTNPGTKHARFYVANAATWTQKSYDLSALANGQLSRTDLDVQFRFQDSEEGGGLAVGNGQGPAIDDFSVSAWKYGPVRSVAAGQSGNDFRVTWARPYDALNSTTPEPRSIAYRVWRSPAGKNTWTEVSPVGRLSDSTLAFADPISEEGVSFEYLVQAWDPGTGLDYGKGTKSGSVSAPVGNPVVTMGLPPMDFDLASGPVAISGMASDSGSGVKIVQLRFKRANGTCWNGAGWVATDTWLPVDAHDSDWATWSASWTPDAPVLASGEVVAVTARVTDRSNRTASVTSYSAGSISPAAMTITRSTSVTSYGGSARISGVLTSKDAAVSGAPVELQYYSGGWKRKESKSTATDGKVYFDVKPYNKTSYRLSFVKSGYQSVVTSSLSVTPRVSLTKPSRPSSARKNRTFYVYGYVKPKHPARSTYSTASPVRVRAYRYSSGKWVYKKTFYAKISTVSSTTSKYVVAAKLPYTGSWKLRAVAPTDSLHYETWSAYTTSFKVK